MYFVLLYCTEIVAVSHLLIYSLLPVVYNFLQRNELENDVASLCEKIANTPDSERLPLVTEFAGKWWADISVSYDGYIYEMNLLNVNETERLHSSGTTEDVSIIAEKSDGKIKISLSQNPKDGTDFFYVERILPNENGYVKATVSRQQIEDAVSTVIVILPITAFLCTLISILSALAYSHMLTKPIKQISSATKQMQELTSDVHCEIHTHDEMEALADNVNNLYDNLLKTIHDLVQEIHKVEEMEIQKTNLFRSASHELKTPVTAVNVMLENMILNVGKYKDHSVYLPKCKILMEQLATMIREILDVSKFEKPQNGEDGEIDLSELIPQALPPYVIIAKSKVLCIETDTYEKLSICYPLPMIKKVIFNLLANAVSYTPKGGSIKFI
jgi:two-component system sensor kinase Ihk